MWNYWKQHISYYFMAHLWRLPWAGRRNKFNPNSGRLEEEKDSFLPLTLKLAEGAFWQGDTCVSRASPVPPYASSFAWARRMLSFPSVSVEFPYHSLARGCWVWEVGASHGLLPQLMADVWPPGIFKLPSHNTQSTQMGVPQEVHGLRQLCWSPGTHAMMLLVAREWNVSPTLILSVWCPGPFQGQRGQQLWNGGVGWGKPCVGA